MDVADKSGARIEKLRMGSEIVYCGEEEENWKKYDQNRKSVGT